MAEPKGDYKIYLLSEDGKTLVDITPQIDQMAFVEVEYLDIHDLIGSVILMNEVRDALNG